MPNNDPETQLVKYLTDAHSIEEQALVQMCRAPDLVEGPLAEAFHRHLGETESQEQRVRERLEAHDASPSKVKDAAGKGGGFGMVLFAKSQPDTPAKQALREVEPDDLDEQLNSYLSDVHALEGQSKQLLEKSKEMDVPASLAGAFADHLEETEGHLEKIERRLDDRGASPSAVKDAMLKLGALNWGMFFAAQPDTPAKLAGFAYAVENLEIAAYELLKRVAKRAGDQETIDLADEILTEERNAAKQVADHWSLSMAAA